MENNIVLRLPLCTNNLLCARLTAGAVASLMSIDVETADDIKVCVNEACLIMISAGFSTAEITFTMDMDDGLNILVSGEGKCPNPIKVNGNHLEISMLLLRSLVDEVDYFEGTDSGTINRVKLYKRI